MSEDPSAGVIIVATPENIQAGTLPQLTSGSVRVCDLDEVNGIKSLRAASADGGE